MKKIFICCFILLLSSCVTIKKAHKMVNEAVAKNEVVVTQKLTTQFNDMLIKLDEKLKAQREQIKQTIAQYQATITQLNAKLENNKKSNKK